MEIYIKKPIEVFAIQLNKKNILEVYSELFKPPNLDSLISSDKWYEYEEIVKREGMKLKTPESGEGTQIANIGDYIVKGYSKKLGYHYWPVKPDYFENAYNKKS